MKQRPTSVTVIAWLVIVFAAIGGLVSLFFFNDPTARDLMSKSALPVWFQIGMIIVLFPANLAFGIAMLKGLNWGRLGYVGLSILSYAISLPTSPAPLTMIPGIVFFVVIAFFLFRPAANQYFSKAESPSA